jgi:3-hydroxyacyl-CoA dehydrogenase
MASLIKTVTVIGGGLMGSGIAQASFFSIKELIIIKNLSIGCCCN